MLRPRFSAEYSVSEPSTSPPTGLARPCSLASPRLDFDPPRPARSRLRLASRKAIRCSLAVLFSAPDDAVLPLPADPPRSHKASGVFERRVVDWQPGGSFEKKAQIVPRADQRSGSLSVVAGTGHTRNTRGGGGGGSWCSPPRPPAAVSAGGGGGAGIGAHGSRRSCTPPRPGMNGRGAGGNQGLARWKKTTASCGGGGGGGFHWRTAVTELVSGKAATRSSAGDGQMLSDSAAQRGMGRLGGAKLGPGRRWLRGGLPNVGGTKKHR